MYIGIIICIVSQICLITVVRKKKTNIANLDCMGDVDPVIQTLGPMDIVK